MLNFYELLIIIIVNIFWIPYEPATLGAYLCSLTPVDPHDCPLGVAIRIMIFIFEDEEM